LNVEHPCLSPWKGAAIGGLLGFAGLAPFFDGPPKAALFALGLQGLGGFYWTWILGKIPGLTAVDAAKYGAMFGVCVAALGVLPPRLAVVAVVVWTVASPIIARWGRASACALPGR